MQKYSLYGSFFSSSTSCRGRQTGSFSRMYPFLSLHPLFPCTALGLCLLRGQDCFPGPGRTLQDGPSHADQIRLAVLQQSFRRTGLGDAACQNDGKAYHLFDGFGQLLKVALTACSGADIPAKAAGPSEDFSLPGGRIMPGGASRSTRRRSRCMASASISFVTR